MNRRGFVATVLGAITAGLSRPWWEHRVYSSSEVSLFNADGTLGDEALERAQAAHQWARHELADRIDSDRPRFTFDPLSEHVRDVVEHMRHVKR